MRDTPVGTITAPMLKSVSWRRLLMCSLSTVGAMKWAKTTSAPPTRSSTSARKSNAFPAASAEPMGTSTDAVPFAV